MNYLNLHFKEKSNQVIYLIGLLFIAITGISLFFGVYEMLLLPVALVAVYICIYRPVFYTLILCFLIPFSLFVDDVGGGFGLSLPTEPMIWLLFLVYVIQLFINGEIKVSLFNNPLILFIVINWVWMFVTVFASSMPMVSLKYFLARTWFMVVFYFFLLQLFKNPSVVRKFLTYLLYGTVIVVFYTLVKHAREDFSRGWGYDIMKPFFQEHTMYSAYISFLVPVALMFALRGQLFNFNWIYRTVFFSIFIVLVVGIIFSYTRASWISLLAALFFYVLLQFKVSFKHMMYALLLVLSIAWIKQDQLLYSLEKNKQGSADDIESHAQSVSNITTDPSNLERVNRWQCAVLMFKERPVFGFGPGTYTFQYAPFQRPENLTLISTNSGDLGNTHSEYFNALSEMGLIGFLSWVAVFLSSIYLALGLIYHPSVLPWVKSLGTAVMLGLFTYYVHAFLNNFTDFDKIATPFWGYLAIITALKMYHHQHNKSSQTNT